MNAISAGRIVSRILVVAALAPALASEPPESAPSRRVAVTFDDLPVNSTRHDLSWQSETTSRLLAAVTRSGAPSIGFVNERKLYTDGRKDPGKVALLQAWLDAGFELGNHTYSHPDLHRVPPAEFEDDVMRGEKVIRELMGRNGREPRYFRHPFLHTGRSLDTKRRVEKFLHEHGYRVAPVTIDNSEWIFARAYDRAADRGDDRALERVAHAYMEYMVAILAYYERQSVVLLGREIPQVLLLHANRLNADRFDDLARVLRARGYAFVTLDEALEDPAYASDDRYTGPGGITWIHRWAITRQTDRSLFRGEPETPAFVKREAGLESP